MILEIANPAKHHCACLSVGEQKVKKRLERAAQGRMFCNAFSCVLFNLSTDSFCAPSTLFVSLIFIRELFELLQRPQGEGWWRVGDKPSMAAPDGKKNVIFLTNSESQNAPSSWFLKVRVTRRATAVDTPKRASFPRRRLADAPKIFAALIFRWLPSSPLGQYAHSAVWP
jgi:hypothetical protein